MDRKKLESCAQNMRTPRQASRTIPNSGRSSSMIFAGTDRRPKPYEGVSTFLGAPLRLDAPQLADFGGLDVALVGVPMDLGVTNRPGARLGPARRARDRAHRPLSSRPPPGAAGRDQGRRRRRRAVPQPLQPGGQPSQDIEAFFARIAAAGVAPAERRRRPFHHASRSSRRWAPSGRSGWCTSMPTATRAGPSRAPNSTMAGRSGRRCWRACSTRSAPSRSASAAGPSTCGSSPTTAA